MQTCAPPTREQRECDLILDKQAQHRPLCDFDAGTLLRGAIFTRQQLKRLVRSEGTGTVH